MAAYSIMWLLLAAALPGMVSGRLGSTDEVEVPSYFGEAAVMPLVNAASNIEAPEAPKLPILLTQAPLQTVGAPLKEEPAVVAQKADGNLEKVCERTRTALSAQADGSAMPKGPVYKECMAALAPLRDHQQDSDAVDTLSDCMALVNALVASKGGDCHDAVGVMQAAQKPPPAVKVQPVVAAAPKVLLKVVSAPKPKVLSKEAGAKQETEALDLVSEAMSSVCIETVRDSEVGIKSEGDAMKLAGSVGKVCQEKAQKQLGAAASTTGLTKEWCHQLDGRLTIALETGFFFALSPDEAERQAAEANPYAATTRRKFCGRFVSSLRKQAQDGALYLSGPTAAPPAASKAAAAAEAPIVPVAAVMSAPPAPEQRLPELPRAPKPTVVEAPPAPKPAAPVKVAAAVPVTPMAVPSGTGVDMLRLVQALSAQNEWNAACTGLVSKLTSEEGSVTEEFALGDKETAEGTKVLTFNAADQSNIRKCAAQLKVLAIQSGVLGGSSSSAKPVAALLQTQTGMALGSADTAEALMDSPWAADACGDIAHGYLTARLAHPGLAVPEFCPLYAKDLQAMQSALPAAVRAKQEMKQLRKHSGAGSLKRHMAQAQAVTTNTAPKPALRAAPTTQAKKPTAALITETASDEEKDGMAFWGGLLQA